MLYSNQISIDNQSEEDKIFHKNQIYGKKFSNSFADLNRTEEEISKSNSIKMSSKTSPLISSSQSQPSSSQFSSLSSSSSSSSSLLLSSSSSSIASNQSSSKFNCLKISSHSSQIVFVFLLLIITTQFVSSAPAYDYENLRDLYEILLRQDNPSPFVHQMERKGGRSPTLRLRFGRRSDPLWTQTKLAEIQSNPGASNDHLERNVGGGVAFDPERVEGSILNDERTIEKVPFRK